MRAGRILVPGVDMSNAFMFAKDCIDAAIRSHWIIIRPCDAPSQRHCQFRHVSGHQHLEQPAMRGPRLRLDLTFDQLWMSLLHPMAKSALSGSSNDKLPSCLLASVRSRGRCKCWNDSTALVSRPSPIMLMILLNKDTFVALTWDFLEKINWAPRINTFRSIRKKPHHCRWGFHFAHAPGRPLWLRTPNKKLAGPLVFEQSMIDRHDRIREQNDDERTEESCCSWACPKK